MIMRDKHREINVKKIESIYNARMRVETYKW